MKILRILFILLILVTIAEGGYYIYLVTIKNINIRNTVKRDQNDIQVSPTNTLGKQDKTVAILAPWCKRLSQLDTTLFNNYKSYFVTEIEDKVMEILPVTNKNTNNEIINIKLANSPKEPYIIGFTRNDLSKLSISIKQGESVVSGKMTDLKVGDKIYIVKGEDYGYESDDPRFLVKFQLTIIKS